MGLKLDRPGFFPDYMIKQMIEQRMIRTGSKNGIDQENNVQSSTFQPTIYDNIGSFVLNRGETQIIPLNESLWLPMEVTPVHDTRSTYGKVEVVAVLADQDGNPIPGGYQGELYAKVTPRSFNVRIHPGLALNQTRFMFGEKEECKIPAGGLVKENAYFMTEDGGLRLGLCLHTEAGDVVGYSAKDTVRVLDLAGGNKSCDFFEEIMSCFSHTANNTLYLFWTNDQLEFRETDQPFVVEMARMDPTNRYPVNGAGLIEHDSWPSRKALEIRPSAGYTFHHGEGECNNYCYLLLGKPTRGYGPRNGNHNLTRLLPGIMEV